MKELKPFKLKLDGISWITEDDKILLVEKRVKIIKKHIKIKKKGKHRIQIYFDIEPIT